ncbi:hypothetical protein [Edaphobacter sp.]|uniref:hypothetical protein n=1 Tax=Edaphobacter sp. TaxID=1934404 RepID=UPI002DBCD56B|nr:hypothetical protein [Edaphobacter sp.]HEU5340005.1 hypothetical protein [Edaphobacter sp.]
MKKLFAACLFLALPTFAQSNRQPSNTQWTLDSSTLTYHITHPLHQVEGTSHAARGKGVCQAGRCDFLIAAPVKTFDSGDSNRDLHMLQVTRGAAFPIVTVRLHLPESATTAPTIDCDLEVQFAGQTAHYEHVPFQQTIQGAEHRIKGTIPATLTDFKITPPSFFTVPIKNEMPIDVDLTWHAS